jgi:thiamine-phosphate diphosphorylase / hydroxyethylthiazole kinase
MLIIISPTGCVVVLTGPVDYISDGHNVVSLRNGTPTLGQITGSGCILGSCIASYCAAAMHGADVDLNGPLVPDEMFVATISGCVDCMLSFCNRQMTRHASVLVLTIGAELAVEKYQVRGPGTFLPGLIDALWDLGPGEVLSRANVTVH